MTFTSRNIEVHMEYVNVHIPHVYIWYITSGVTWGYPAMPGCVTAIHCFVVNDVPDISIALDVCSVFLPLSCASVGHRTVSDLTMNTTT